MVPVAVAVAFLAQVIAWRRVATGRASVWRLMIAVLAAQGLIAVVLGGFRGPGPNGPAGQATDATSVIGLGVWTGAGLYVATRGFVVIANLWPAFRRAVEARYADAQEVSLATALVLSLGIAVTSEELFWRGLVQGSLVDPTSPAAAAILSWLGYVMANLASASLPIIAGAIVGGAVWGGLAWYTGGILASLVSHAIWTGLMLAFPPRGRNGHDAGMRREP